MPPKWPLPQMSLSQPTTTITTITATTTTGNINLHYPTHRYPVIVVYPVPIPGVVGLPLRPLMKRRCRTTIRPPRMIVPPIPRPIQQPLMMVPIIVYYSNQTISTTRWWVKLAIPTTTTTICNRANIPVRNGPILVVFIQITNEMIHLSYNTNVMQPHNALPVSGHHCRGQNQ